MHGLRSLPNPFADKLISRSCQEGYIGFRRYHLGQRSLSGSRRSVEQNTLWCCGTIGTIKVFDLHLATAVDADDQKDVLSAEEKPDIHWSDIVVSEDVKSELQYFQSYLKDAKSFLKKGATAPKGILLYGPPGTGKT